MPAFSLAIKTDIIDKYHYFNMDGTCTTITEEKSPTAVKHTISAAISTCIRKYFDGINKKI